jgi:hypothetical protein
MTSFIHTVTDTEILVVKVFHDFNKCDNTAGSPNDGLLNEEIGLNM